MALSSRARAGRARVARGARWQVFGLAGIRTPPVLLAVASQADRAQCSYDGVRSHSPLRGSPGFAPGSLLPRTPLDGASEPAAGNTICRGSDKTAHHMSCRRVVRAGVERGARQPLDPV